MSIIYHKTITPAEALKLWGPPEQAAAVYGVSPMLQALPTLKELNDLPPEERAKASAAYVDERLSNPNDEWWP